MLRKSSCQQRHVDWELEGGTPRDIRGNASCWPARRQVRLLLHPPGIDDQRLLFWSYGPRGSFQLDQEMVCFVLRPARRHRAVFLFFSFSPSYRACLLCSVNHPILTRGARSVRPRPTSAAAPRIAASDMGSQDIINLVKSRKAAVPDAAALPGKKRGKKTIRIIVLKTTLKTSKKKRASPSLYHKKSHAKGPI